MKISFKNIAIALGVAAGATAAAVITTKTVNKQNTLLSKKSEDNVESVKETQSDELNENEDDILYV